MEDFMDHQHPEIRLIESWSLRMAELAIRVMRYKRDPGSFDDLPGWDEDPHCVVKNLAFRAMLWAYHFGYGAE